MSFRSFVIAFAFGGLAAFGAIVTLREGGAIYGTGISAQERVDALVSGSLRPAFSSLSEDAVLNECFDIIPSLVTQVQPAAVRDNLLASCESIADSVAETTPVTANAQLVLALVYAEQGRTGKFNEHLARAQGLAPNEAWLIYRRVALAMSQEQYLSADGDAAYNADLGAMVTSQWGVAAIAERYADDPAFRERIARIVERLPEATQAQFVSHLRSAVMQKSPS